MRGKKPRADAPLKNLPADRQEQVIEWCGTPKSADCTGGYTFAREQLAADGVRVSLRALSEFWSWWHLEKDLALSQEVESQVRAATGNAKAAREAGEEMLLKLSLARQDPKLFTAAAMSIDQRRNLDLMEESGRTKAAQKNRQLGQKDKDQELAERKFQRDSCKLFLKWFDVDAAKKIATSGLSNTEKIEQLGLAMFGEDWKA